MLHDQCFDHLGGRATNLHDSFGLGGQDPTTIDTRPRHEDGKGDPGIPGDRDRSHQATFTVPDDADPLGVDSVLCPQPDDGGQCVIGEIHRERRCMVSGRLTDTTIVIPEACDTSTCQGIGKDQERLVPHERLVAILRPAASHQHDDRRILHPIGNQQRACQLMTLRNGDTCLHLRIGEGWLRRLGSWIDRNLLLGQFIKPELHVESRLGHRAFKGSLRSIP